MDYALMPDGKENVIELHWHGPPADHAIVVVYLQPMPLPPKRMKKKLICRGWEAAQTRAEALLQNYDNADIDSLRSVAKQLQKEFADDRTCAQRRQERLPLQVRVLWKKASEQNNERQRKIYKNEAWRLLQHHIAEAQKHKLERAARMGRAPRHQPALHKLTGMEINGEVTEDQRDWVAALRKEYNKKWKAFGEEAWVEVLNRSLMTDGEEITIEVEDFEACWHRLDRRGLVREDGVCVESWRLFDSTDRGTLRKSLQTLLASTAAMRSEILVARVGGKNTPTPRPPATRIMIPGNSVLQLLDVVVSRHVGAWLERQSV